jgi:DNA-directed RNA polymerase subunit alpha
VFVIEPLERGFGHTLGNSMRRVLLSSLRGSAVWAFRIEGVVHEHQTIQGVVEDVHQVIQNLKSLVVTLDDDVDEAVLEINVSKAGAVTAADIQDGVGRRRSSTRTTTCSRSRRTGRSTWSCT